MPEEDLHLDVQEIRRAQEAIREHVMETPLLPVRHCTPQGQLKAENLQPL